MKASCKIIIIWAVVTTIISVYYCAIPLAKHFVSQYKLQQSRYMSLADRKNIIIEKITEIYVHMDNLALKRQINRFHAELVLVDTMDINNLITYGYDCFELSIEEDSLNALYLRKQSINVANKLRLYRPRTPMALINAAKIYTFNGLFDKNFYDSADVVYRRITSLVENDSVEVPPFAESDKARYLAELKDAVQDLQLYNEMNKRVRLREYFRVF